MIFSPFETILSVLSTTLIVSVVFRRLKLPAIVGFLLVGAFLGPHGVKLIPDIDTINEIAEFGVVFLMFTIGLEFSKSKLWSLKKAVFIIGGLQVLISIAATMLIGRWLGMDALSAWVVGAIVAMSSTAIVVKQLHDQGELHTTHGLNAVGILLFQDMAVIPLIIFIAALATHSQVGLSYLLLKAFLKGIAAIVVISLMAKWLLRPLFHQIAKTQAIELFTLTVLLITLMAAWLTHLAGLSYSLGAFVAGIMLSETEFRHQIEIEIRPFRDVLLGLFFITIGMLADVSNWYLVWKWIALLLFALMFGKMLLVIALSWIAGYKNREGLRTGILIGQGSEFGFAILTLALGYEMLPADYGQVVLAALIISLTLSPIFIYFNNALANFIFPTVHKADDEFVQFIVQEKSKKLSEHIIICGYGRVGQQIGRLLTQAHYPFIGLDIDPEVIASAKEAGEKVLFGDASHPGILKAAGINRAKALVLCFGDIHASRKVLSMVRRTHAKLPILVRCKDQREMDQLKTFSPTKMIAETFEESIMLSEMLLQIINIPPREIISFLQMARNNDYQVLRK